MSTPSPQARQSNAKKANRYDLRCVLDTNILISRLLKPDSSVADAVRKTLDQGTLLTSQAAYDELTDVVWRFVRREHVTEEEAVMFLASYKRMVEWIPVIEKIQVCRDPKDDAFLELAVNGKAGHIVTGDKDLLVLHPFRGIAILSPVDFMKEA